MARGVGALDMSVCYLRNDSQIDAERCRISLREKARITIFALDSAGRIACLTGVIESMQFDPGRAIGMRWRVIMLEDDEARAEPSRTSS
jgi:hypothetical protein